MTDDYPHYPDGELPWLKGRGEPLMDYRSAKTWWPGGLSNDMRGIRNPEVRESGLALCAAMGRWLGDKADRPDVDLVIRALRHNSTVVSPDASMALALILEGRPDCEQELLWVYASVPANARALLLRFIGWPRCIPRDIILRLVTHALSDRSERVRSAAVEEVESLGLQSMLPRLRAMQAEAKGEDLRGTLELHIPFLERGYLATWSEEFKDWNVWLRDFNSMYGISIPAAAVENMGMAAAVDHARECLRNSRDCVWETASSGPR